MEILTVSFNHHVTPLELREAMVFDREGGEQFLGELKERAHLDEAMLISTCNRTEVYTVYELDESCERRRVIIDLLRDTHGFPVKESPRNYTAARNEEAVRHLFRVAGGLESQIMGESQILGQVKHALEWSRAAETSGRVLHRLWERALRVGKRVRSETAIGEGTLSASYAALELARKIFGTLKGKHVLVIGTGEIGSLALENLQGIPLASLTIMNRTRSHAEELANRFGGDVRDLDDLPAALESSDLVISSTSSPEPLIRHEELKTIRGRRGGNRPLLIVDLAMPRDFEERCGTLDEVFLKNLDDLGEIVESNVDQRRTELPRAEAIIEAELTHFSEWLRSLEVEPTIRKLRELFHAIREEELEAARKTMDAEELERFERATYRLVNRLLHVPSENLRRHVGLRDRDVASVVHDLLTTAIPHPREREKPAETEPPPGAGSDA